MSPLLKFQSIETAACFVEDVVFSCIAEASQVVSTFVKEFDSRMKLEGLVLLVESGETVGTFGSVDIFKPLSLRGDLKIFSQGLLAHENSINQTSCLRHGFNGIHIAG
jgi:hypothetical protein